MFGIQNVLNYNFHTFSGGGTSPSHTLPVPGGLCPNCHVVWLTPLSHPHSIISDCQVVPPTKIIL